MTFNIRRNVGMIDRILRGGLGVAMIYFGFFSHYLITDHIASLILGGVGIGSLLVAVIGFCPLYTLIGFSTCIHRAETTN